MSGVGSVWESVGDRDALGVSRELEFGRRGAQFLEDEIAIAQDPDLAAGDPRRFAVVDAAGPVDQVAAQVLAAVLDRLEGR